MESPTMSTYILTVALAGVGGWALAQALTDDPQPQLATVSAQGQAFGVAPAPQGQVPVVLNLTTPPAAAPQPAPVAYAPQGQRAGRQQGQRQGRQAASSHAGARAVVPSRTITYVVGTQPSAAQMVQPVQAVAAASGADPATYDPARTSGPMAITASNGAIVYISQQGNLIANTGATSTSGIVALGVQQSDLGSGRSSGSNTVTTGTSPAPANPLVNSSWQALAGGSGSGSSAVSGFEDHSVSVVGDGQVTTYDDSNVFLFRDGDINANTGDTDSSGLNAVDVWDSHVRAGNSGDGEDVEQAEDDAAVAGGAGTAPAAAGDDAESTGSDGADTTSSDDEDSADSSSSETGAGELGGAGATVTDEGASTALGAGSLVVGADGYDDVSVRTQGNGNITTYDDSNVVIGGTGHVNAQIGDSDTGGTVVMGIHGSDVEGGCEGDLCATSSH